MAIAKVLAYCAASGVLRVSFSRPRILVTAFLSANFAIAPGIGKGKAIMIQSSSLANKPFFRRRSTWVAVVLVLGSAGALFAYRADMTATAQAATEAKKTDKPVTLEFAAGDVATVNIQAIERTVAISGSLTPLTQSLVKSTVPGQVKKVLVREGQTVKVGDIVAEIDTTDLRARLDAAQADHEERRSRLTIAARNRDTNQALLKQNFISQNAYDQTQSTYQGSDAAVRWADAQVRMATKAMNDAVVRSPIAGVVAKRMVNGGERITPDAPIVNIVDLTRLELEASIPASDVPSVLLGQTVRFRVDGFGERQFEGKVERINPVAEPGSRAIKLFVAVPNPDNSLKGGMFAEGVVALSQTVASPVIPFSAVFEEAGQSYVFSIEDGKLAKRAVSVGQKDEVSGLVAVKSGLNEGVSVVRIRMTGLKVGAPAMLKTPTPTVKNDGVSPAPTGEKKS
ncbi:MAG: efflux RND transporter periplasmic adaptor subunit [Rhodocyclaceae bacterium]|nr:efflux RND transporter periplasmic adaptor subunit [Rhodocyclaceae bacterium]